MAKLGLLLLLRQPVEHSAGTSCRSLAIKSHRIHDVGLLHQDLNHIFPLCDLLRFLINLRLFLNLLLILLNLLNLELLETLTSLGFFLLLNANELVGTHFLALTAS